MFKIIVHQKGSLSLKSVCHVMKLRQITCAHFLTFRCDSLSGFGQNPVLTTGIRGPYLLKKYSLRSTACTSLFHLCALTLYKEQCYMLYKVLLYVVAEFELENKRHTYKQNFWSENWLYTTCCTTVWCVCLIDDVWKTIEARVLHWKDILVARLA